MSSENGPELPQVYKVAIWHNESGLIVSPFGRGLPLDTTARHDSTLPRDYRYPRCVEDSKIHLAFYPRRRVDYGFLFRVLAISNDDLYAAIRQSNKSRPSFFLDGEIQEKWASLENLLLQVTKNLLEVNPYYHAFPDIDYPRLPHQHGYRHEHRERDIAYRCAMRAREAFTLLSALSSFAVALCLSRYEDSCFDRAWDHLARLSIDPIPRTTLQYLKESIVCDFSSALRPGCFLDPYCTRWGGLLRFFVRARVPVWLMWGLEDEYSSRLTFHAEMREEYFPPPEFIKRAKETVVPFTNTILPFAHTYTGPTSSSSTAAPREPTPSPISFTDNDAGSNGDFKDGGEAPPKDPMLIPVEAGSGQRTGETWEEFRARLEKALATAKANPDQGWQDKLRSRQRDADAGRLTSKAKVFKWVASDDNPNFLLRTKVTSYDAQEEFRHYTDNQRRFWPHCNHWDLNEYLPRYPEGTRQEDMVVYDNDESDDGYDPRPVFVYDPLPPLQKPQDTFAKAGSQTIMQNLVDTASASASNLYAPVQLSLSQYLRQRHGFTVSTAPTNYIVLHDSTHNSTVALDKPWQVSARLGYRCHQALTGFEAESAVDFNNTAIGAQGRVPFDFSPLPNWWDMSPHPNADRLPLPRPEIIIERATATKGQRELLECHMANPGQGAAATPSAPPSILYVLRPADESRDPSPWFVATTDPTTILFVHRRGWVTMMTIARGLLELGVPFRTVLPRDNPSNTKTHVKQPRTGLGKRPMNWTGTREDYAAYKSARNELLRSTYGRAIRTRGGIAGRLAAEAVPDVDVFAGPSLGDELVGIRSDGRVFVDDLVPVEALDSVSGLYCCESYTTDSLPSWWPRQDIWRNNGYDSDQWTPDAEKWYQERLEALEARAGAKDAGVKTQTGWKTVVKRYRQHLEPLLDGSRRLASTFIEARLGP